MNLDKLKIAELNFLNRYPGGFAHPDMVAIGKTHKMDAMKALAQTSFSKDCFKEPESIIENLVKVTTRSSMVSVFEKPKFRDYVYALSDMDKGRLVEGLKQRLHGNAQKGFEQICSVLTPGQLAKWSLVTVIPAYFDPTEEVFIKPTTAKGTISHFELKGLTYNPKPTWAFYEGYREAINLIKTKVDADLSPSNAAFCGFLMMSVMP
jgi:hypothetical protein